MARSAAVRAGWPEPAAARAVYLALARGVDRARAGLAEAAGTGRTLPIERVHMRFNLAYRDALARGTEEALLRDKVSCPAPVPLARQYRT